MPTLETVIELLKIERQKIDSAIALLESRSRPRRGLPPKLSLVNAPDWVTGKKPAETKPKRRRTFSLAQRKKQAASIRLYWKNKKAATA
jgi:hypothetical protein